MWPYSVKLQSQGTRGDAALVLRAGTSAQAGNRRGIVRAGSHGSQVGHRSFPVRRPRAGSGRHEGRAGEAVLTPAAGTPNKHHGRTHIARPMRSAYECRPGGLRTGSPPSPPPRLIRPIVRLLPRSPRLSGPGPHQRPRHSDCMAGHSGRNRFHLGKLLELGQDVAMMLCEVAHHPRIAE
jgi:hypothetical protein